MTKITRRQTTHAHGNTVETLSSSDTHLFRRSLRTREKRRTQKKNNNNKQQPDDVYRLSLQWRRRRKTRLSRASITVPRLMRVRRYAYRTASRTQPRLGHYWRHARAHVAQSIRRSRLGKFNCGSARNARWRKCARETYTATDFSGEFHAAHADETNAYTDLGYNFSFLTPSRQMDELWREHDVFIPLSVAVLTKQRRTQR